MKLSSNAIFCNQSFKNSRKKKSQFLKFFKEEIFPDKERLKDLINVFTIETVDHNRAFGKYFKENYDKYQTFNEYFESYKQNELQDKIDEEALAMYVCFNITNPGSAIIYLIDLLQYFYLDNYK